MKKIMSALMALCILATLLIGCSHISPVGLSKENPVIMGKSFITSDGIKVTIVSAIEGDQAWEILQKANQFNPTPTTGMQYSLINVKLQNVSSQPDPWEYLFVYWDLFELVGSSNTAYHTYDDNVVLPEEGDIRNTRTIMHHGDEANGTLSFYIPQTEKQLVLTWLGSTKADQRFFAVKAVGTHTLIPASTLSPTGPVEATEFSGQKLTPINQQNNNALAGTQIIDQATYRLTVDGLVDHPLSLSYADLQAYPQISQLTDLNCVEGWDFTAKWTGPDLSAIFADAGVKPEAKIAIFYTTDVPAGYSSLDLSYIEDKHIIIALKDNDIILPPDRGFPFQVIAMSKFGYKWAKWVTRIELSSDTSFRGYWESAGYDNNADINGPALQSGQ
jgi:DMSO/TMAO reductase YedYZ molybdopterin-dependent catalytic subunit